MAGTAVFGAAAAVALPIVGRMPAPAASSGQAATA